MNYGLRTITTLAFLLCSLLAAADGVCVVVDGWTGMPVAHASLYSREGGKFRSAITDGQGRAVVSFAFKTLTVSHLNYEKLTLRTLPDTIELQPKYHLAAEVTVSSEPAWIRPKLRQLVSQKAGFYLCRPLTLAYDYATQSIAGNAYYRFCASGLVSMSSPQARHYSVSQRQALIVSADTSHLTDMTNMRRMLYEDFLTELDNGFIRSHKFSVSDREDPDNPDIVELIFKTRKGGDRGTMLIDTAQCRLLAATRTLGTKANKALRVAPIMLTFARAMSGYRIDAWDVDYRVTYGETNGCWHAQDVAYKFYMQTHETVSDKQEREFDQQTGAGFSNMEATMHLRPTLEAAHDSTEWMPLPAPWYIKLNTQAERDAEIRLARMAADFQLME